MQVVETLQAFGLTQYEAKAFAALVETGRASAYQVSKQSGIPRARVYDTLESLVNRGLVMTEETKDGSKWYTPLPVDVLLEQYKERWESSFRALESGLRELQNRQPRGETYVTTVKGKESILSYCRTLIQSAERQILLSMWEPMYRELLPALSTRAEEGIRLRGILFEVDDPLPGLFSHRRNEYMSTLAGQNWFILSVDSRELLYGHSAERDENAFYTDDPVHLFLLEDYIWHDVLVNRLVEKGDQAQLDGWILPEMEHFFGQKMLPDAFWQRRAESAVQKRK